MLTELSIIFGNIIKKSLMKIEKPIVILNNESKLIICYIHLYRVI